MGGKMSRCNTYKMVQFILTEGLQTLRNLYYDDNSSRASVLQRLLHIIYPLHRKTHRSYTVNDDVLEKERHQ